MDFLFIVDEFVTEIAGKDAVKLFNLLKKYQNISEFTLAEELKMSINQVRNLLYKLNAYNLVFSNRKKDREKGWYIYYWTFNFKHARDLLRNRKEQEIEKLKIELEKQRDHKYYVCPTDGIRYELEDALESNYKCNECGTILRQEDASKKINEIESRINKLTQDLEELNKQMLVMPQPESLEEDKIKKKTRERKKARKKTKAKKKKKKVKAKKKTVKKKLKKKKGKR